MMRRGIWLAAALLAGTGCGYVGDVQPPALHIPMAVQDLTAVQRGARLRVAFTRPVKTTEQLPLTEAGEIDLRVGPPGEGPFDANNWANTAARVPAAEAQAGADIAAYAGKEVLAAVRTMGPRGRWSAWSNVVIVRVVEPLGKPSGFAAASDAGGVRLTWSLKAPPGTKFRIFRQAEKEDRLRLLASTGTNPYVDGTAEYGMPYKYQVQAAIEAGNGEAESDPSEIAGITPVDTFAPAVPKGLNAIAGLNAIELAWDRNTEADFRGYHIYRSVGDGAFARIGELTEAPAFSDKSVQAGTSYRYSVAAVDQRGNESARSEPVAIAAPQ